MSEQLASYDDFICNHGSVAGVVAEYLESMAQNDEYTAPTPEDLAYSHNIGLTWARRIWSTYVLGPQITLRRRVDLIRTSRA